ncbi:UDP-glucose--hexose-1-phosphate uridylyltransferase [Exiguobacterium sp. 17-1]|uniref:UDP-glucose--hexose-1-phosphate uridylyltransferase n=1 Tax=Exiguobacterium sp. 17-1 TaxID=2931981 RepID=UPI001FFF033F|nr:UDP-glucose--hexose-1-phosphate uridylyltransferase [Exiguobacterium sp. 17-1]MCK2158416.1 UDP-glucose--hexose-1-phosphate uridylyltransferase [Exiguobacterium sp. 17-1]
MNELIKQLVEQAIRHQLIQPEDAVYARNRLLALLGEAAYTDPGTVDTASIPDILDAMIEQQIAAGQLAARLDEKERLAAELMDVFVDRPSTITSTFRRLYAESPQQATDYFYQLSQANNYIQTKRIAKNIQYQADTVYGEIDITINLSKPEKDPREIAAAQMEIVDSSYPTCLLCVENVGYAGRINHPARANHRIVPLSLEGEAWALQYSPYVYYNEHSIILSQEHRDMVINRQAFARLLEFVAQFPHYFAGSNADLPIVGGSILTHDHYQGGRYEFAMDRAQALHEFVLPDHPDVTGETLHWPLTVVRLSSSDASALLDAADEVYQTWLTYEDTEHEIIAATDGVRHNTVTPIARMRGERFELDLVLRNNRTSAEHPDGIFHTHADIHHIKRENIGLIEVMGLAVLPARLLSELKEVEQFITGTSQVAPSHQAWAEELKATYAGQDVSDYVRQAVAAKFVRGLEDCGVFKQTEHGQAGLGRFLETVSRQVAGDRR